MCSCSALKLIGWGHIPQAKVSPAEDLYAAKMVPPELSWFLRKGHAVGMRIGKTMSCQWAVVVEAQEERCVVLLERSVVEGVRIMVACIEGVVNLAFWSWPAAIYPPIRE